MVTHFKQTEFYAVSYVNNKFNWFCHHFCSRPILCHLERWILALMNWKFRGYTTVNVPELSTLYVHFIVSFMNFFRQMSGCGKFETAYLHPKTKIMAHPSCDQNIFCNRAGGDTYPFKCRVKCHLPIAGIIRSSPYSPRSQDKGYFTVFFDTLCPKLLICFYVCV